MRSSRITRQRWAFTRGSAAARREEGADNQNRNVAIFYASQHVLNSLFPQQRETWRGLLLSVGLDPDNASEDPTTAVGVGNVAGKTVLLRRERDGMNQLGDERGRKYNRQPYADYTGYKPVNTAYDLKDPSRWQPQIITSGHGLFRIQQFVTPQMRLTQPFTFDNPNRFNTPPPHKSNPKGRHGRASYKEQADEVLAASAALSDYQKMVSELFNNKIFSLGFSSLFVTLSRGLTLEEFVQYDFCANVAAFDSAIVVWNEKTKHDSVRPFSAIRHLYGDSAVTAWGGPGKGTVNDLPASQWRSYLQTADHPEYPSASATFCAAHAQASRRFLGTDALGWSVPAPAGSSQIEPGITPATDIVLGPWETWTEFEQECGLSRFWAGVHFLSAIEEGRRFGRQFGDMAYEFVKAHIDGTVP